MQGSDRGPALSSEADAVPHERPRDTATTPCGMHRDGRDPLRRHGLPPKN